ncbi:ABC transporter permease [Arhodomonas sp. AD133]|uniref:ABC transporter permease n=1 Tax=Arhodomonas sp. AD133 TaxID=3415009 RepID=UPI003EB9F39F
MSERVEPVSPGADVPRGERVRALATHPLAVAGVIIVALLVVGEWLSPGFASADQILRQLTIAAILGTVAAGQNLVILGGREGIDLSVGALVSLGAVMAGNVMDGSNLMLIPGLVAAVAVTGVVGLVNGVGVTVFRIPPLVMTLGMLGVIQGALVVITSGVPSGDAAPLLVALVSEPLALGIPGVVMLWAIVAAGVIGLLRGTRFGYRVYAVGSNDLAAALSGIPVRVIRASLFGLSGAFAGLAGAFVLGYTGNSFIGVGEQYMLPSIIAVVIGGTSLAGGIGGYAGTVAGAIVLTLLQSILTTLQLEAYGRQIVFGGVLLALMLVYGRQRRLRG